MKNYNVAVFYSSPFSFTTNRTPLFIWWPHTARGSAFLVHEKSLIEIVYLSGKQKSSPITDVICN